MLSPNTLLQNRYRIVRRIGQGGMGAVYEARHEELSYTVALKETFHTDDESLRRAFKREARMLASLRHTALPRVTDYFMEGDGLFLVMEYIAGNDLMELLGQRQRPFDVKEVLFWAEQLLDVLNFLHTQDPPVIHRDIKPNNIKLNERGDVILLDFGLAKGAATEATSVLASRSVLGFTLTYAPLEQILKADPNLVEHLSVFGADKIEHTLQVGTDARSDLYSLGATLYHLLTKKQPAQSPTRALAVWSGRADPLLSANNLNPQIPQAVSEALQKAMALESENRFASAAEMLWKLREATQPAPTIINEPIHLAPTLVSPTLINTDVLPPTIKVDNISVPQESEQTKEAQRELTHQSERQSDTIKAAIPVVPNVSSPSKSELPKSEKSNTWLSNPITYILPAVLVLLLGALILTLIIRSFLVSSSHEWELAWSQNLTVSNYFESVQFSPDGKTISSGGPKPYLWDAASGRQLTTLNEYSYFYKALFSPDSKILAANRFEIIKLVDATTGREIRSFTAHSQHIDTIAFSPNGRILASGSRDKTIKLWDVATGTEIYTFTDSAWIMSLVFIDDRKLLSRNNNGNITLWDIQTSNGSPRSLGITAHNDFAVSPDGKTLAQCGHPIVLWDIETDKKTRELGEKMQTADHLLAYQAASGYQSCYSISFSPDGKTLASGSEGAIKIWDVESGKELQTLNVKDAKDSSAIVKEVAFSRNGKLLAGISSYTINVFRIKGSDSTASNVNTNSSTISTNTNTSPQTNTNINVNSNTLPLSSNVNTNTGTMNSNVATNTSTSTTYSRKVTGLMDLSADVKYERLVTIQCDPLPTGSSDYSYRREGDVLYVYIKNAILTASKKTMDGEGGAYYIAELQQSGNDVVLTVKMKEGTRFWVWKNNNVIVQVDFNKGARKY